MIINIIPIMMNASARLKVGQKCKLMKSITKPCVNLSIKLPIAPAMMNAKPNL